MLFQKILELLVVILYFAPAYDFDLVWTVLEAVFFVVPQKTFVRQSIIQLGSKCRFGRGLLG